MIDMTRQTGTPSRGEISTNRFEIVCLWLIGFTSTLDIFGVAKVGNTAILMTPIIAFFFLLYEVIKGRGRAFVTASLANKLLVGFVVYAIISAFFPLFNGLADRVDVAYKGLAILLSLVLVYASITVNATPRRIRWVTSGLILGITANALYGIYQYVGSYHGFPGIQLHTLIEQAPIGLHRAQGFFREPSYFAALLVPALFIAFSLDSSYSFLIMAIIVTALFLSFSSGSVLAVIVVSVVLLIFLIRLVFFKRKPGALERKRVLEIVAIALIVVAIVSILPVSQKISGIAEGARFTAPENALRTEDIVDSLRLGLNNPLGVGYNMGPPAMEKNGAIPGTGIHSYFAALFLETGIPGTLLFILFVLALAIPLLREREWRLKMIGLAALVTLIYSFVTYNGLFYFQWVIWGLADAAYCVQGSRLKLPGKIPEAAA